MGGGPAGCAVAVVLARAGLSVCLLDDARGGRTWAGESLPPGADRLIHSVFGAGLLASPPDEIAYGTASSWGSTDLTFTDFVANPLGRGWHVDRAVLDAGMRDVAAAEGVRVLNHRLAQLTRDGDRWTLDGGVQARWVVDASGRAGAVVGRLGVERVRLDRQVALVAVVDSSPGEAVTTVEAVETGWWYTTPLPGGRRVIAYLTDADLLPTPAERSGAWHEALAATRHVGTLVGAAAAVPRAYPADTGYRVALAGDGWVAVGDAAVSWDPLSSQGMLTGVLMGARAGAALAAGTSSALVEWVEDYRLALAEHEDARRILAVTENRWPESPFWSRRRR